jgi:hypothetical protein
MSLGTLALKIQDKYKHGLQTAYYRDVIRKQILDTKPIISKTSHQAEIHVLTSATDWLNLIWALKSFYHYSQRNYALCIHDDGTLDEKHYDLFLAHFPNARIIDRPSADTKVLLELQHYPHCLEFRKTNHLAPKVFDFLSYLESDRLLLLDSDVLFFTEPRELLNRIENPNYQYNSVNADIDSAYTVDPAVVKEQMGFEVQDRFNSGLGLIHKQSLNLEWIEEFLGIPNIVGHFWRIEQTLFALCSSKFGVELLPEEYNVRLDKGINDSPSRHYVGAIRHLMYGEGIKHLIQQNFLTELCQ